MAKKIEDKALDKKTKEKLTNEILSEINESVKEDLVKKVVNEVEESFDKEYIDNIKKNITDEVIIDIKNNISKEEKKLIRRKSFKIFRMYIYLLIALIIIGYLCFIIYKYERDKSYTIKDEVPTITKPVEKKDLNWYLEEYGDILDNVKVNNYELLKGSYKVSDIDITDKLAMAYYNLDSEKINKDGMIYTINKSDIYDAYVDLFGSDEGYKDVPFTIDNVKYAYSTTNNSYIAVVDGVVNETKLENYITNIVEEDDMLVVTAAVAIIKDNKVYNIYDEQKEVANYTGDLSGIVDKLSKVNYKFKKIDGEYKIYSIEKSS